MWVYSQIITTFCFDGFDKFITILALLSSKLHIAINVANFDATAEAQVCEQVKIHFWSLLITDSFILEAATYAENHAIV